MRAATAYDPGSPWPRAAHVAESRFFRLSPPPQRRSLPALGQAQRCTTWRLARQTPQDTDRRPTKTCPAYRYRDIRVQRTFDNQFRERICAGESMAELFQKCSVCHKSFHVQFSYQMEELAATNDQPAFRFYCSQSCAKNARPKEAAVACSVCGKKFEVTHAAHLLVLRGRRKYACSGECRAALLEPRRDVLLASASLSSSSEQAPLATPSSIAQLSTELQQRPTSSASGPRVLAVFNHKGGTGKTTTAVSVAAGLARRGYRTLLIDTDAQGNVAVSLGLTPQRSLYHLLVMGIPLSQAVVTARDQLDVLASNETLAAAELYLAGRKNRDRVLKSRLEGIREQYDYVIVDCSPSLSLLNQNALVLADAVLCPVACDYLSLVGVRQVVKTIKNVNRLLGHPVALWGVLPTLFDRRARICREALETLQENFGERCLEPIRSAIRVKEAPSMGRSLQEYAADSNATADYENVVSRLVASGVAPKHRPAGNSMISLAASA
jgi:chromosome partitioning protein